jgi:hypothetical protein
MHAQILSRIKEYLTANGVLYLEDLELLEMEVECDEDAVIEYLGNPDIPDKYALLEEHSDCLG